MLHFLEEGVGILKTGLHGNRSERWYCNELTKDNNLG